MDIKKYELKKWPRPPREICDGHIKYILGIVSPALVFINQFEDNDNRVTRYFIDVKRYQLYKRTLTRYGYKELVRAIKKGIAV